jgi:hypothetical protein
MQELLYATSWWPSAFGPDDEAGMLNHVTPAKRLQARSLVRSGRLYDLGRVLDEHVPGFPGRRSTRRSSRRRTTRTWAASARTG